MNVFGWLACAPTPPIQEVVVDRRPDILLVTIDTLRADRLGSYGDELAKTPNLDRLASEGMLFTENHSVTPLTLPSHVSMLTGLLPKDHGVRDNAGFSLGEEVQTIAETLQDSGYDTGAFVSAYVLSHAWGLDQGFDLYHDPFHPRDLLKVAAFGEAQLPGNEVLNVAKTWWKNKQREKASAPKFGWIHLYDPHTPWDPPKDWKGDPYRGEIAKVDRWMGEMFALSEDAWVIVTSDHGESLWEFGEREHGVLLHRSVTRVPLIIRPPGGMEGSDEQPTSSYIGTIQRPDHVDENLILKPINGNVKAAKIIDTPVSGLDIAQTIAGIAEVPFTSDGKDLLNITGNHLVYAETYFPYFHYGWHPLSMVQNEKRRLESGSYSQIFAVQNGEVVERSDSELESKLVSLRGEHPTQINESIPAEQEAALQSLGYQTDFVFPEIESTEDPRLKIGILKELHSAEQQSAGLAIVRLEQLVEREPMLLDARLSLAYVLSEDKQFEKALEKVIEVLQINPNHSVAMNNAVILSHQLKQYEIAIQFAETMIDANANDVRPYRYLAAIYAEQEKPNKVVQVTELGLEIEPNDPNLNYLKGLAHVFTDQFTLAIPNLMTLERTIFTCGWGFLMNN